MAALLTRRRRLIVAAALLGPIAIYVIMILAGAEDEGFTENSVFIDRPPEVVFDYASDMRHELEWNPDVEAMAKITDGPVGLGTRFAAKWKQSPPVVVECTRFDRPTAWTAHNGGPLEVTVAVTIKPQGTGSLFTSRFTARPHGFMKLIFPAFKFQMVRFERAVMGHVKRAIESHPR